MKEKVISHNLGATHLLLVLFEDGKTPVAEGRKRGITVHDVQTRAWRVQRVDVSGQEITHRKQIGHTHK